MLKSNNIDIAKARGQAYDGTGSMSSERVGVQSRIKVVAPLALYTHCRSHVLNLSIASACKIPSIRNMVGFINETYLFFDLSPKRQRFFEHVLTKCASESMKTKLSGLCKTRWVERHTCYETFYEFYKYICLCLEAIVDPSAHSELDLNDGTWEWDSETKIKAQGLLQVLKSSQNILTFLIAKNVLEKVKPIAVKLQKRDIDVMEAYNMIDYSVSDIKDLRNNVEEEFNIWFQDGVRIAEEIGVDITVPRLVGRQAHRPNATTGHSTPGPEEYYRINVAIPFIDHLEAELTTRFNAENRVGCEIFRLVPTSIINDNDVQRLATKLLFWEVDIPTPSSLLPEIKQWQRYWKNANDLPTDLHSSLQLTDSDVFPNIAVLLIIGCTLPITSAEAERSFSGLRRIKSYLRSRMTEERLSGLALMHIHSEMNINVETICDLFVTKHRRRMFQSCILYQ